MQKRTIKVAILAVLALILVLSFTATAFADSTWSDLPDTVTAKYAITDNQVASISDGYVGGLWKPYQSVTRAQFTKMAVAAFKVDLANPAVASYTDVAKGSQYYQYIEGAKAAGMINGTTATTFSPNAAITRQQAIAIVSRYIADAQGYDLATMYSAADIDVLLGHFGDAASVSASLKAEVAFAFDMGITEGNAFGNLAPLANLTRIQGAAFLIRAEAKVPPAQWTAEMIDMVTADKSENLIGQTKTVTFKVTDAAGHPAAGVLVDFDTLYANPLYVGNISPQAGVTDSFGMVSCNLISHEPGTEKVSATVMTVDGTLKTLVYTAYWVALDEVYLTDPTGKADPDELNQSENNAGEAHTWSFRVVVFGPGPLSSGPNDWYNAVDPLADPTDIANTDGVNWGGDLSYADELDMIAEGYVPRTMAGIDVEYSLISYYAGMNILPLAQAAPTPIPSIGMITKVDGVAITPATKATGMTDANGLSTVTLYSEMTGTALVQAVATYDGNPYPKQLVRHAAVDPDDWTNHINWQDQPTDDAYAWKTWIPHIIGGDTGPLVFASNVDNTGEDELATLTLKDVFGNPIPGYQVEWTIQGVGQLKAPVQSVTGADGTATVMVYSSEPGQTILEAKVEDKSGMPAYVYTATKQWYQIDDVSFVPELNAQGNPILDDGYVYSENLVNTPHTFSAMVSGEKWVWTSTDVNNNGLNDDEVLVVNRASAKAATGFLINEDGTVGAPKAAGVDLPVQTVLATTASPDDTLAKDLSNAIYVTRFADATLTAGEMYAPVLGGDDDGDDILVVWKTLPGKNVYFFNNIGDEDSTVLSDTPLALSLGTGEYGQPQFVGSITAPAGTPPMAVTDANGMASVTINSTVKGDQYVFVVADYADNPENGIATQPSHWNQLLWDMAEKVWLPDATTPNLHVFGVSGAAAPVDGTQYMNPILDWDGYDLAAGEQAGVDEANVSPNVETLAVEVFDQYGNALPGYKVVWQLVQQGTVTTGGAMDTYHPYAHFKNAAHDNTEAPANSVFALNAPAVITDTDRFVDTNPIWGYVRDTNTAVAPFTFLSDDDLAWGYTLNGAVNNTETLDSAAHVDLVLDEEADDLPVGMDYTDIVNVSVYAPDGTLWKHFSVTKEWAAPVATTITLTPASQVRAAGVESASVTATVLDQFGNPMPNEDVTLTATVLESSATSTPAVTLTDPTGTFATNAQGQYTLTWTQPDDAWGVQKVVATDGAATSGSVIVQWALNVADDDTGDLADFTAGTQTVALNHTPPNAYAPGLGGMTATMLLTTDGTAIGSGVFNNSAEVFVPVSHLWTGTDHMWVHFATSIDTDGIPNWLYALPEA